MQDKSLCVRMPEVGQSQREMVLAHTASAGSHAWPGSLTRGQNKQMHLRCACKLGRAVCSTSKIPATSPKQVPAPLSPSAALPVLSRTTGSNPRHTFDNQVHFYPSQCNLASLQSTPPCVQDSSSKRKADLCPQKD